jgi:hypothetical protein
MNKLAKAKKGSLSSPECSKPNNVTHKSALHSFLKSSNMLSDVDHSAEHNLLHDEEERSPKFKKRKVSLASIINDDDAEEQISKDTAHVQTSKSTEVSQERKVSTESTKKSNNITTDIVSDNELNDTVHVSDQTENKKTGEAIEKDYTQKKSMATSKEGNGSKGKKAVALKRKSNVSTDGDTTESDNDNDKDQQKESKVSNNKQDTLSSENKELMSSDITQKNESESKSCSMPHSTSVRQTFTENISEQQLEDKSAVLDKVVFQRFDQDKHTRATSSDDSHHQVSTATKQTNNKCFAKRTNTHEPIEQSCETKQVEQPNRFVNEEDQIHHVFKGCKFILSGFRHDKMHEDKVSKIVQALSYSTTFSSPI